MRKKLLLKNANHIREPITNVIVHDTTHYKRAF